MSEDDRAVTIKYELPTMFEWAMTADDLCKRHGLTMAEHTGHRALCAEHFAITEIKDA